MKDFKNDSTASLSRFGRDKRERTATANSERVERRPNSQRDAADSDQTGYSAQRASYNPRFTSDNRPMNNDRPRRDYGDAGGDRSFAPKRGGSYGDKPSFGERNSENRPSFSQRRDDKPSFGGRGERSGDGDGRDNNRAFGDRDRKFGDRPAFGDRDRKFGDKPAFGDRDRKFGDKPAYGDRDRKFGDKPAYGDRDRKFGDKPAFGDRDRKFGDKPAYGDRDRKFGDKPAFGDRDRKFGDKPAFGDRDRKFGDKPAFGDRDRKFGDRPSFGDRPRFEPKREYRRDNATSTDYPRYAPKEHTGEVRLNRYLAQSGISSRREADEFIQSGLVTVNGVVVTELGSKVMPNDEVKFKNNHVQGEKKVYLVLNKPKGFITSLEDPHADKTVMDLVGEACEERIYPVGRLDKNSVGLLLFTNDGDMTKQLTHPSYKKKKIYQVTLDRNLEESDMDAMAKGITLEDGEIYADAIAYVKDNKKEIGLEIHSGRNRIVRRMFEHLGYSVGKLDRVYYAGLTKKNLKRGDWRFLTNDEVQRLQSGQYE